MNLIHFEIINSEVSWLSDNNSGLYRVKPWNEHKEEY
jgi:hypothetical protein